MKAFKLVAMIAMLALTGSIVVPGTAVAEEKIIIDGSTTVGPIAKAFAEYYMALNSDVNITVSESGSGNGANPSAPLRCWGAAFGGGPQSIGPESSCPQAKLLDTTPAAVPAALS